MTESPPQPNTDSRRLFLTTGTEYFQILSFSQRPDGSIYISAPNLATSKWMELVAGDPPQLWISDIPSAGKLSVHGSGVAHVRASAGGDAELRLAGNYLRSEDNQALGLRHLITVFSTQPTHLPVSAANSRLADSRSRHKS